MIVTKIEPVTKTKFKIFIDEQFAFVLYKGELSRYRLKQDEIIETELFNKIKKEVILKRGKLRALHLLNGMDRSESQLRDKLKQNYYTEDIIEQIVTYVKSFGYISDQNFARRYIESRQMLKSKKEIRAGLYQKGIEKDVIEESIELYYKDENETMAIQELLRKKRYNTRNATEEERQKICAFLARRGFRYEDIRHVIQVSPWNA